MNTLPVEVVQHFLDYVEKPSDLVAFHRLSTTETKTVTSDYWRHRVSTLLGVEISPSNMNWAELYSRLMAVDPTNRLNKFLPILLEYQLPRDVVLVWAEGNPDVELDWILQYGRFDLALDLTRLRDPEVYIRMEDLDVNSLERNDPVWAQLGRSVPLVFSISSFFIKLLADPRCPLSVLVEFNKIYQLIEIAHHAWSYKRPDNRLMRYLSAAEGTNLTQVEALSRVMFILSQIPLILTSDTIITNLIIPRDSLLLLFVFLRQCNEREQEGIKERLFLARMTLKPRLRWLLTETLTPFQTYIISQQPR
jgi:hypothetical protein